MSGKYQKESTKPFLVIIGIAVLVFVGFLVMMAASSNIPVTTTQAKDNAATIATDKDQILEITAKGGYRPGELTASAGKDIVLRVNTKGTYDCSSAFEIPKFGISKTLPPNGVTEFRIPAQQAGAEIEGSCSMRMYFFKIKVV